MPLDHIEDLQEPEAVRHHRGLDELFRPIAQATASEAQETGARSSSGSDDTGRGVNRPMLRADADMGCGAADGIVLDRESISSAMRGNTHEMWEVKRRARSA